MIQGQQHNDLNIVHIITFHSTIKLKKSEEKKQKILIGHFCLFPCVKSTKFVVHSTNTKRQLINAYLKNKGQK